MTWDFKTGPSFDDEETRARVAKREQAELEAKTLVHCVICGDACVDHGEDPPMCSDCDRAWTIGRVVDGCIEFLFGGRSTRKGRGK